MKLFKKFIGLMVLLFTVAKNYEYSKEEFILVLLPSVDVKKHQVKLIFNKHLIPMGGNHYKIIGTDNILVNKMITNPKHKHVYEYDNIFYVFKYVMELS